MRKRKQMHFANSSAANRSLIITTYMSPVLAAEGKHFCSGIDLSFLSNIVAPPDIQAGRQRVRVLDIGTKLHAAISSSSKFAYP
jgi:hypothetical protein